MLILFAWDSAMARLGCIWVVFGLFGPGLQYAAVDWVWCVCEGKGLARELQAFGSHGHACPFCHPSSTGWLLLVSGFLSLLFRCSLVSWSVRVVCYVFDGVLSGMLQGFSLGLTIKWYNAFIPWIFKNKIMVLFFLWALVRIILIVRKQV